MKGMTPHVITVLERVKQAKMLLIMPPIETRFSHIISGESNKHKFAFCAAGDAGEEGTLD
jgi:hypothetical protein